MQAEIITIGDEILIGQILDSNSKWIAEELNKIGISVYQITSIQDDKEHIIRALDQALECSDIIIITGGLGPTNDDITKKTLTEYFDDHLILDEDVVQRIKTMFKKANYPFTNVNRDQALIPSNCTPLLNHWGTAPGMWFRQKESVVISLPGVPNEMKGIMSESVLGKLKLTFDLPVIVHKTVQTYGMGESMVAERIYEWELNLPDLIKLAYLPSYGKLRLRLSATGSNEKHINDLLEKAISELYTIIPDIIVGIDEASTIEAQIGALMTESMFTLAVAESCTGGAISSQLTKAPGASKFFKGGVIAYSAEIKIKELCVEESLIHKYSVVSSHVAEAMAQGIQKKYKSDYAIATTGNAGPTTDATDKTVGTVFIAIASPEKVFSKEFFFGKPREKVIERTSNKALELLRKEILKNY